MLSDLRYALRQPWITVAGVAGHVTTHALWNAPSKAVPASTKSVRSSTRCGIKGEVIVIDHVPAEVCTVCGDVLLRPDTVRRIEEILHTRRVPSSTVPLYEYA
jgi:YgiT-type zinc finger domain-containing protein